MKILVVGSGGREHALVWKLAQEAEVYATPGNPGIVEIANTFHVAASDADGLIALCREVGIDFVVIGPEDPLIAGVANRLRLADIPVVGPDAKEAQLEGSKAFAKELMVKAGVPTAAYAAFSDTDQALDHARSRFDAGRQVAVKASGAALGKGVVVCDDLPQAEYAIEMMLRRGELGDAGRTIVIEDRLVGKEFSLLTLVSGREFRSLPVAQDYKRIFDGDEGPNTGGMGTCSPVAWLSSDIVAQTEERVVRRIVDELERAGMHFRGILFSGLLVQDGDPHCLEFNVRFGDPETQTVLPLLGAGFADALHEVALGHPIPAIQASDHAASVTVVAAAAGYPSAVEKGQPITIGELPTGATVFQAGTVRHHGELVTNGGRVLGVNGVGPDLATARRIAYDGIRAVSFPGMQYRSDIGAGSTSTV